MFVNTIVIIDIESGNVLEKAGFEYSGPVALCCGASSEQKGIFKQQESAYKTLMSQAQTIFGGSSKIFSDLTSAFEPILAAGPGQEGFTAPQMANLKSQAITETGQAYRHAAQAAGERGAAAGGGSALLPSGTIEATRAAIARAGAGQTAQQLANIRTQSAELGRQNWLAAANVLGGAPGVFNPATSAAGITTGAGEAAANTANQIAQANNSWMTPVAGILGGVAGGLTGGLMGGGAKPGGTVQPSGGGSSSGFVT